MQETAEAAADPGRRPAQQQQFAGVDLRRPKGYAAPATAAAVTASQAAAEGDPCPRCESTDTKFCYYNNYNTSQPRHFCKGCRRYWTKGGTLRNVPVGGGTRKKPTSSSSPPSSYAAAAKPKKPYKKKRRVVAAPPPPEPASTADSTATVAGAPAADYAKPTKIETAPVTKAATPATDAATPTTTADGASEITTELVVPASAEEEDSLAHLLQPDVALGLGISDFPAGKGLLDAEPADSFEWPATFDLGTCWGSAGFADMDPAGLFLNLP